MLIKELLLAHDSNLPRRKRFLRKNERLTPSEYLLGPRRWRRSSPLLR